MSKASKFIFIFSIFFAMITQAEMPKSIWCGFSETADWPSHDREIPNPGGIGIELVYQSTYGDRLFVFVTTMLNISNAEQMDMTLLIQSSQGGGFTEVSARGLVESPQKWNGASAQVPMQRQDGGLYFLRVSCGI